MDMKKIFFTIALFLGLFTCVNAQLIREGKEETLKFYPLNWHQLSFDREAVYGLELDKAYEFLKGKEKKQQVIVAVIDGGFDDQHEDLKDVLWTNPGEIAGNGIDDDKNGYTDDLHGWNFLVTKDGKPVVHTMNEAAKLFLQKKDRYDALTAKTRNPKEEAEYKDLQRLMQKSELGNKYLSVGMTKLFRQYVEEFNQQMKEKYPGETLARKHFDSLVYTIEKTDTLRIMAHMFYNMMWGMQPEVSWEKMFAGRLESERIAQKEFDEMLAKQKDERTLVGDDMDNIKDRGYGSPSLIAESAEHGTHVAGIIGACRGNDIGIDGIAGGVKLMLLRAVPEGDENDKDVALAIRYAVDNGAKVINMSFGKSVSLHREWVSDALKYAEKKGVLLVHGAGNSFADVNENIFYPTRHISPKKSVSNFITVGSSDPEGNPAVSSNYGSREVDVFAPGVGIYSTVTGDNYKKMGGTSMACPMVSGVAALLMTYYPELSAAQIRDIIIRTAVTRKGEQVLKPQEPTLISARKMVAFSDMCVAGGIVNAYEAVKLADEMVMAKKK